MKKKLSASTKAAPKRSAFALIGAGEEKDYFIENLAMLLASGMDIVEALDAIKIEIRSKALKKIIASLEEDINAGVSLWEALDKTGLLPSQVISLVRIGETSGRLHESLGVIVTQQEKNRLFKSKIRAAMMYPLFVLGLALVVGIGIAWFILPRLSTVFAQLNLKLPLVTRVLMSLGGFLSKYGSIAVPLFILVTSVLFFFIFIYSKTKFIGQKILFVIPGVKRLIREVELSRFGYIMGTLLQGGLPVVEALHSLSQATPLFAYQKLYAHLEININDGKSFQESFLSFPNCKKLVPVPIQSLVVIGEHSGRLTKIFLNIAETFENKTEITTKNLSVILEPVLLVVVWLGVVAVALAVILPIYSLVGGLSQPNTTNPEQVRLPTPQPTAQKVAPVAPTKPVTATATSTPQISTTTISTKIEILPTSLGYLNIRAASSTQAAIIGRAEIGTVYTFIDHQDGWYAVVLPTSTGWISERYVKVLAP